MDTHDPRSVVEAIELSGVSSRSCTVTNKSNSLTHSVASVRGVSWSDVTTVPKRKSHRGLDLDLSLNSEVNIRKGWKENGGTK